MVTQQLASDGVIVREAAPSSEVMRVRFADIDGLRGLAACAIVIYEAVRLAPPLHLAPAASRAAADASQGLALFLAISGFALAYPALAVLREDGRAYLDIGRYAVKRVLRIYPAYLVALVLAFAVPPLALRYGLPALASGAHPLDAGRFVRAAFFADDGLGNDGFAALGLVARCYVAFPFALVLWTRRPRAFAILVAAVAAFGVSPIGAASGVAAFVPFLLGIVAADVRAQHHRSERFACFVALVAAIVAVAIEPVLAGIGARAGGLRVDPLWSLALAALVAGSGAWRPVESVLGVSIARFLGAASFAISLVAVPVIAFAVRQLGPSVGAPGAAVNAAVLAIVAGIALWQFTDRWFADAGLRREAAAVAAIPVDALLRRLRIDRLSFGSASAAHDDAIVDAAIEPPERAFYAPPPRASAGGLTSLSQRTGSPEELAAEIHETKKRLAERSAAFFASDDDEPESQTVADAYEVPGFYRKVAKPTRVALASAREIPCGLSSLLESPADARTTPSALPDPLPAKNVALDATAKPVHSAPPALPAPPVPAARPTLAESRPIRLRIGPSPSFTGERTDA